MLDARRLHQAREAFVLSGVSVADWARQNNFSAPLVYAVLQGRNQATRGESHRIAVALGVKPAPQEPLPSFLYGTLSAPGKVTRSDSTLKSSAKEAAMP
jgi:gp16 family phage-associated protein